MNKTIRLIIKIVISILGLYFVFRNTDFVDTLSLLSVESVYWFIPALLLYLLSKFFTAIRYSQLLKCYGCRLEYWYNLKLYLCGMYYNLVLPGGVSGDIYKAYILKKNYSLQVRELVVISVKDRVYGLFAIGILLAALLSLNYRFSHFYILYILFTALSFALYYLLVQKYFPKLIFTFNYSIFISLIGQLLQVGAFILLLMMMNVKNLWVEYSIVFLISSLMASLPFTIGGLGARELTFYYFATLFSLDVNLAVMSSMLFYLVSVISSLLGMPYSWMMKEDVSLT